MRANCTSHSGAASIVAPASIRTWGCCPGTGMGTAIAGRAIPLIRPMRSSAAAIAAPVFPALIIASASPSRTACAQRTTEASFSRRTAAAGSSSIAMTSRQSTTTVPSGTTPSGTWARISSSRPYRRTSTSSSVAAASAPATISAGALSPPMASIATVIRSVVIARASVDVDDLATAVGAAVGADAVRKLGGTALRADRLRRQGELHVRRPSRMRLAPRGLALRDGHRLAPLSDLELGQRGPTGIGRRVGGIVGGLGGGARVDLGDARLLAVWRERELEEHGVPDELLQVDFVALD